MILLEITNDEKMRLKHLNDDKATIHALKKHFLNICSDAPDKENLAAERIALEYIKKAFYELSVLTYDINKLQEKDNIV